MNEQQLFIFIIVSILVMVALAIGVLILYNVSQNRILAEVEAAHKIELEYQTKLLSNSIEVQERERSRIAKDLHDEIGSKLNIVNLNLNVLKSSIPENEASNKILEQIEMSLNDGIDRARSISHELLPPVLSKFGIQSALSALASDINRTGALRMEVDVSQKWMSLSSEEALHLYRIVQELVNNTIKHAEANNITLSLAVEGEISKLIYKDDGIGILSLETESVGLGMSSIYARADLINARLEINSDQSNGFEANLIFS